MKKFRKYLRRHLAIFTNIGVILSFVFVGITVCVNSDESEKAIAKLNQDILTNELINSTLVNLIDKNAGEISQLNQEILSTKQYVQVWGSFTEALLEGIVKEPVYDGQTSGNVVENPISIHTNLREFESPGALMSWAKEHLTNLWIVGDQVADCDDYALRLQLEAYKDGYLLSVQVIKDGMLNGKNVSNYFESHMGNLAVIGNEIYFIEPQPEYFRIVFVCNRD